ncbi:hypothetical protein [Paenibacillus harenae]|uniref:Tail fiber protein n=1 Tax=Paenibacillus harenae TaxID=306543 RepID=A0ABT9U3X6_PAEHA|nr:hypothetical protein [Paenibacillus harenae]MDQ0114347.1 hypothetical protein [Paenibacillus harenae]
MGAFGGLKLTNKGLALQGKVQAGAALVYTKMAMGDGELGSQQIPNLTALISLKKTLSITKLTPQPGGKALIGTSYSNSDITAGFYFRELGVFANDPDDGEILYCYGNAGAGADYIPPGGGADLVEEHIVATVLTGNAANVSAVIDDSLVFVTTPVFGAAVGDMSTVPTTAKNAAGAITELFTSVSDGKELLAAAITDKGVPTAAEDSFQEMADNISDIVLGSGNAQLADVLSGKTFSNDSGPGKVGTMANRGAVNILPGMANQTVQQGYHNGAGIVQGDTDLISANIKAGVNIFGVAGKTQVVDTTEGTMPAAAAQILTGRKAFVNGALVTGSMADRAGDTAALTSSVSGTTLKLLASAGYRDGVDDNVTITDPDFIAANIANGVNLFGLVGTLIAGSRVATGQTVASAQLYSFVYNSGSTINKPALIVSGLSFTPKLVMAWSVSNNYLCVCFPSNIYQNIRIIDSPYGPSNTFTPTMRSIQLAGAAELVQGGFTIPANSETYNWYAVE